MHPYDQPKFIKDTLDTKDILGTSPKIYKIMQTRENYNNINIKKSPIIKNNMKNYNYMDYSDITKDKFKSNRHVNPLEPVYDIKYEKETIGYIAKSKPNPLYKVIYNNPMNNLKTDDIKGAQVGSKNKINRFTNQVTNSLIISDIPGACPGSLKKKIVTNRVTNPLWPEYEMPGHTTVGKDSNPFGENKEKDIINKTPIKNQNNYDIKKSNNLNNKDEILKEINQISNNYLHNKNPIERPKSHSIYSYNRDNVKVKQNNQSKNNSQTNSNIDNQSIISKMIVDKKVKKNNYFSKGNNSYKNNIEENNINKRINTDNGIDFGGKENEIIDNNNQKIFRLNSKQEFFKKPSILNNNNHKEIKPNLIEKEIKFDFEKKNENLQKEKIDLEKFKQQKNIYLKKTENNKINRNKEK